MKDPAERPLEVAERMRVVLDLFDLALRMKRQSILRAHPDAGDADVQAELDAWLRDRPGAPDGDADGVRVPWPRR